MFCSLAQKIRELSVTSSTARPLEIAGQSAELRYALVRTAQFAQLARPVLITGESGVGKELFARAIHLLSQRRDREFYVVNCGQYQNDELLVSELFGHEKGSFTGAISTRRGLFDLGDGGVVFLDEVAELSPQAQAMLLRVLGEGEIKPLGGTRVRHVDVKVIAATNRPLHEMVGQQTFRNDLFYRLNGLSIHIPPVRDRGDDWRLLVQFFLDRLNEERLSSKRISEAAWSLMDNYHWPGNVREIENIVDLGFCLTEGDEIEPKHFEEVIAAADDPSGDDAYTVDRMAGRLYREMVEHERSFWEVIREPYMNRDLNRAQVRAVMRRGLRDTGGSYKRLLKVFSIRDDNYLKFMDFLRHHDLKPERDQLFGRSKK